jgi:hypothetical protein
MILKMACGFFACFYAFFPVPACFASPVDWNGKPGSRGFNAIRNGNDIWIDLTVTRGMSYNSVLSEIGAGLQFEDWRVATADETTRLLLESVNLDYGGSVGNRAKVLNFLAMWGGPLYQVPRGGSIHGSDLVIVADLNTGDGGAFAGRKFAEIAYDFNYGYFQWLTYAVDDDFSSSRHGVALVRQIPEPSSASLAILIAIWLTLSGRGNRKDHPRWIARQSGPLPAHDR